MAEGESLTDSSSDPNPNPNPNPNPTPNPEPCSICLSSVTQDSYLDKCFHKFCYNCIIRWINVVASKQSCASSTVTCPLCKTENLSIIYGYDGTYFQRHYVGKSLENSEFFSEAHRYRLKCYYTEPGDLADKLHVSHYWKFRKYIQHNHFLGDWLRREFQALIQVEDVDIIMHHTLGVVDSLRRDWIKDPKISTEKVRQVFRASVFEAVRPFLTGRTERFVNELELFVGSGMNIEAFDKVYIKHLGWKFLEINENEPPFENHTSAVPYLYILDEDSDEN